MLRWLSESTIAPGSWDYPANSLRLPSVRSRRKWWTASGAVERNGLFVARLPNTAEQLRNHKPRPTTCHLSPQQQPALRLLERFVEGFATPSRSTDRSTRRNLTSVACPAVSSVISGSEAGATRQSAWSNPVFLGVGAPLRATASLCLSHGHLVRLTTLGNFVLGEDGTILAQTDRHLLP
jgi:hypothetical protein